VHSSLFITISRLSSALTLEDEIKSISHLICGFIRSVSFGHDKEQQLSFYVEARASFCNIDSILIHLVQVKFVILTFSNLLCHNLPECGQACNGHSTDCARKSFKENSCFRSGTIFASEKAIEFMFYFTGMCCILLHHHSLSAQLVWPTSLVSDLWESCFG
jgi:hypothetical protein